MIGKNRVSLILAGSMLNGQALYSQLVEGKDYSKLANVYKTFDIAGDDIFGQRFPSENYTFKDEVTGVTVNALTTSRHSNSKMYQTHPQWTADSKYIFFHRTEHLNKMIMIVPIHQEIK
ncbi:hypothetical protein ACOCEA_01295 [Maribacter sp. CXY002]|uniref:hypothetical protein n=1 Tax=Maribacter luteocoastalis TaxID=3407671 RepID=UPI003B67C74E